MKRSRMRKIADGIQALCSGAESDKEYCNGVNICMGILGIDIHSEVANQIRDRTNAKHHISILPAEHKKFIDSLVKKPEQYRYLSDKEIKLIANEVIAKVDSKLSDQKIGKVIIEEAKKQKVGFRKRDESNFICICLELMNREITKTISDSFFSENGLDESNSSIESIGSRPSHRRSTSYEPKSAKINLPPVEF